MKDVRSGSSIFCVCRYAVVPAWFLGESVFPPLSCLGSFVEDVLVILCGSVPGSPLCYTNLSVLLPVPSCLDLGSFRVSIDLR